MRSRVWHAVATVTSPETLCGKDWRRDPLMNVETCWKRVTCKRCLRQVEIEVEWLSEVELLLDEKK